MTSISWENILAAAGPSARSRTIARGITTPAEQPSAARKRKTTRDCTFQLGRQRALGHLAECQADKIGGKRVLRRGRVMQIPRDGRKGREVHIRGDWADRDKKTEQKR